MNLRSVPSCACVVSLLLGLAGCQGSPSQRPVKLGPVDEGRGSLTAARKYLEGQWTLESFEIYPPGKAPVALKGSGTLTYDEYANLKIDIHADQDSSDLMRAAGIDIQEGVTSSSGRTVVDMQNKTLTYVIAGQPTRSTGPLALTRPRHWQVEGPILTLTTQDDAGKPLSVSKWKKIP
jgi:hypothetical protein